jgi:Zn-dependent alcohol dehydrogenase
MDDSLAPDGGASDLPATMRAAVLDHPGDGLRIERIPVPVPRRDEALVRVTACGVCHSDLHVLKGEIAFPTPAVLGHEISGTVVSLGEGTTAATVAPGDLVVGAFIMPCNACVECARGRDDLCLKFFSMNRVDGSLYDGESRLSRSDGSRLAMYSMGGMAEYAVVPVSALTRLFATVAPDAAAILGCAVMTGFGAVRRGGDVRIGESVAVIGIGGVGTSIVQVARQTGAAPIIAVDVSDEKLALARELGAHETVNARDTDAVEAVRALGGDGVDVVFEALGSPRTFEQGLGMLREGGRLVAVGLAATGQTAPVEITRLVRRSQRIIGSYGARTRTDLPEVARLAADGAVDLDRVITDVFDLEHVADAFAALAEGRIRGRAIVRMR